MGFLVGVTGPDGVEFSREVRGREVRLGRAPENDVVLDGASVSKRHARIGWDGRGFLVEDLGSRNGTMVSGRWLRQGNVERVPSPLGLEIGPYRVEVLGPQRQERPGPAGSSPEEAPGGNRCLGEAAIRKEIHEQMIQSLDLRRLDIERIDPSELRRMTEEAIDRILDRWEEEGRLPPTVEKSRMRKDLADEALGLGALEELLADDGISEVMVNGSSRVYVERAGRISLSSKVFSSDAAVLSVIERIVATVGRRIDESSPMVDARLQDGSRVHAIIPPLSLTGPCITIRKFRKERLTMDDLVSHGALDERMSRFLRLAVRSRKNIVVSGGTGSGKTTLLNILTESIPESERIITVEDAAELQIRQPHWIRLESRPANAEGRGEITIRELVKACLRMRPDRIVVGECRGGEALDMLQAMNTGHDGSLTTLHANGPRDALARMETLCLMSGMDLPVRAIREQIASAVDLIVQQARFSDGARRITSIVEVVGMEGETITLQEIFGYDKAHRASGFTPAFCQRLVDGGEKVDLSMFRGEG